MKKLVIKTACITLCAVVLLSALLYGAFCLFSPKTLAKFFDNIGFENLALKNYEREYNKTEDIVDLYTLVSRLDEKYDAEKCEKYSYMLLSDAGFDALTEVLDGENPTLSTSEYVWGKYALSLTFNGKFNKALTVAENYYNENGYTQFSPFRLMANEGKTALTNEQKHTLKSKLMEIDAKTSATAVKLLIQSDIASISN